MELKYILLIISIVLLIIYTIVYCSRTKLTKRRNSKVKTKLILKLIRNIIVIGIVFLALSIGILFINDLFDGTPSDDDEPTTTTTTETTTTTTTTTTKRIVEDGYDSNKYIKIPMISGEVTDKGKTSKGFKIEEVNGITYVDGYMIVNKTYGLPSTYEPNYTKEYRIGNEAKEFLDDLIAAASKAGYSLRDQSGYRSYDTQEWLYNNKKNSAGKAEADRVSARPGYSEHQTGLATDICDNNLGSNYCIESAYGGMPSAVWLENNCWKYGFILRYVKGKTDEHGYIYEAWHFRYVGFDLAYKLYNNGNWLTMEDYFGVTSEYAS